ncbi:hypothetical protein SJDPG4_00860 [Porphyromonas gingivalis SJD4]|nr:hypothetical protein SJDPG4_00860 [Porphyromonas gingivalis SJD4]
MPFCAQTGAVTKKANMLMKIAFILFPSFLFDC